jgi:hypothetical protein
MNKDRRKQIDDATKALRAAHEVYVKAIESARGEIESARDDESEAFDRMPEGLQGSERGETMQDIIGSLDEFIGNLQDREDDTSLLDEIDSFENDRGF